MLLFSFCSFCSFASCSNGFRKGTSGRCFCVRFILQTCCDNRNHNLVIQLFIQCSTEDDFCFGVDSFSDQLCCFLCFHQTKVHVTAEVNQDMLCTLDGCFQERALDCHFRSNLSLIFTACATDAHVCNASVCHDGSDIGKVQIDNAGLGNQIGNALYPLQQNFIRLAEGLCQGCFLINNGKQSLVGDDNQRIYVLFQLCNALFRIAHSFLAFKIEGLCHNADRQDAQLLGNGRNAGSRTCACAAAHACGNEHHIGTTQCLRDIILCFIHGALTDFRVAACAQTLCQLFANLDFRCGFGFRQSLSVCIDGNEFHPIQAVFNHSIYCVVAAAANTDYFNLRHITHRDI